MARWARVLDVPDGRRKLHLQSVPLLGGVAVFNLFYVCLWLVVTLLESPSCPIGIPSSRRDVRTVARHLALGIVDDKWSVRPWMKIAVQILAWAARVPPAGVRIDTLAHGLRCATRRSAF